MTTPGCSPPTTSRTGRRRYEDAVTVDAGDGWTIAKGGAVVAGPGAAAAAAAAAAAPTCATPTASPRRTPCTAPRRRAKLAFADREAWYGDSAPGPARDPAVRGLRRRAPRPDRGHRVGRAAAGQPRRPGAAARGVRDGPAPVSVTGSAASAPASRRSARPARPAATPCTSTSWTQRATWSPRRRPAAGCSPRRRSRRSGFCLGTRAQMFWLEDGLAVVAGAGQAAAHDAEPVAGAARRRAAARVRHAGRRPAGPVAAVLLARPHRGRARPAGRDRRPRRGTPRRSRPRSRRGAGSRRGWWWSRGSAQATLDELRRRGHVVTDGGAWALGRLCAVGRGDGPLLRAGRGPAQRGGRGRRVLSTTADGAIELDEQRAPTGGRADVPPDRHRPRDGPRGLFA